MNTSPLASLFKPRASDKISLGTLGYVRARNKQRAYSLIIREFKKSGLSQADLAKRLGKGTDVICRLLSRPGNWGLDTFSDLLFGITGSLANFAATRSLPATQTMAVPLEQSVTTVIKLEDNNILLLPTVDARSSSPMRPTDVSHIRTGSNAISSLVAA
jgi:cyanate lyase